MSVPAVSIIIPTYNYGRFIEEALASVFEQTYRDFEGLPHSFVDLVRQAKRLTNVRAEKLAIGDPRKLQAVRKAYRRHHRLER